MTTAREHMAADMAWILNQDGEGAIDIVIDAVSYRSFPVDLGDESGSFDGELVFRRRLFFLAADFSAVIGQEKDLAGKTWRVVAVLASDALLDVTFERLTT